MTQLVNQLLAEAEKLSESERGELAARLIASLDPESDRDAEAAWSDEIQRRVEEVQAGAVAPLPWAEARRLILDDADDVDAA